jgi:hypothetical protein
VPVAVIDLSKVPDLDAGEQRMLSLIDDERTIEEIRLQSHATEYQVCKLLFDQCQAGNVKLVKLRGRLPAAAPAAAIPVAVPTAGALVAAGRDHLARGDFDVALRHLRAARDLEPESQEAQEALLQAEKKVRGEMERAGVSLGSIPQMKATMEQITSSQISPQEGFMLTRINGSYDIQSILKITPMAQLDALLLFWKLANSGYIHLAPPRSEAKAGSQGRR